MGIKNYLIEGGSVLERRLSLPNWSGGATMSSMVTAFWPMSATPRQARARRTTEGADRIAGDMRTGIWSVDKVELLLPRHTIPHFFCGGSRNFPHNSWTCSIRFFVLDLALRR